MTNTNNTLTRFWVNQSQTAAIRLGDFTPAELRTIAAEIESICPPVPIATAEATPAEGGWVSRLLWCKVQRKNIHCAVNEAWNLVVPFNEYADEAAYNAAARFNDGTSKVSEYHSAPIYKYEEAHV